MAISGETDSETRQYASLIAELAGPFRRDNTKLQACVGPSFSCATIALAASLSAYNIAQVLAGANKPRPNNRYYVGPPPPEIAGLVDRTIRDARVVSNAGQHVSSKCQTSACTTKFFAAKFSASSLADDLNGWAPYL